MDTAHWPQEFCSVKCMEEMAAPSAGGGGGGGGMEQQRRAGPQKEQAAALPCPRCGSTNTKFCYYNNYSLTQPRYFCKACRRYWTEGGSLRNVPVGGGSRKNKRPTSAAASPAAATPGAVSKPKLVHEGQQDLGLAFTMLPEPPSADDVSAMELLRSTGRGPSPFVPMHSMPVVPVPEYSPSGFAVHQDYRSSSSLTFPLDGISGGYGSMQENNGRLLFPFEDSRQVVTSSATSSHDQGGGGGGDPPGFWSGMMGGGGGEGGGPW